MNIFHNKTTIISCLFLMAVATSCKVAAPVQMPAVKPVPESFSSTKNDSASIADISWRKFFTDQKLVSLIDVTLVNNTDLMITLQRIEAARAQVLIGKGALLPSVNGVVSGSVDKFGDYTMTGVGNFDTNLSPNIDDKQKVNRTLTPDLFVGFRSNWEIDLWGKLRSRKKAAIARLLAAESGRRLVTTTLVAEVASNYYQLLSLDYEMGVIRKNIALQETALDIVKIQKEGGRATELAVQQFAAQLLNTKALEFGIRQQIVLIENKLNVLAGRYPQAIARDSSLMRQQLPALVQTGFPSQSLTRRPDIQQAEQELEAAKADVSAARAAFYPSLILSPAIGFNSFKPNLLFNGGSLAYGVLGGLTAPIFNQNQLNAGHQIANAQNKEAVYNYQKTLLASFSEVVTSLKSIENNQQSFLLKEQELKELGKAVTTARELYLNGYANYLEIITAQKGMLDAELQLTNNKKELFLSTVDLYRSLGGGWE
jgi:multidrug efflux system outer membrane protein